jgi:hypothetical protein
MMHLLTAQPAVYSDVLKCEIYNSTNLVLALDFTDDAPTSKLFGPAQLIPAIWGRCFHTPDDLRRVFAGFALDWKDAGSRSVGAGEDARKDFYCLGGSHRATMITLGFAEQKQSTTKQRECE